MINPLRRNVWLSAGALFTSVATLVCCVLPAVLVSIGAGAAVVGLVTAFPQLVWLSERKVLVFGRGRGDVAVVARASAGEDALPTDDPLARLRSARRATWPAFDGSVRRGRDRCALAAFVLPALTGDVELSRRAGAPPGGA